jgi:tetratricopeptide (TPR) repeat protein
VTNEHAAQRVEDLRREWKLDLALKLAEEIRVEDLEPDAARNVLVSVARIHREYGRWKDSTASLAAAATHGAHDPWLEAESWIDRYWHASLGALPEVLRKQAAVRAKLDEKLTDAAATDNLAPLYWASAAIRIGPHPDDAPSSEELREAEAMLEKAQDASAETHRVQLTRLRLEWVKARKADDRPRALKRAFRVLSDVRAASLRSPSETHELDVGVRYIEGRLLLLERDWSTAKDVFAEITDGLALGHQAAHVWGIYCERILTNGSRELLPRIDELLRADLRADGDTVSPPGREAIVLAPHLESEVLSERAAIIEDAAPEEAKDDYQRALDRRPRMTFAQRALLRCEVASGRSKQAAKKGERLLEAARDEHARNGIPLPADILAEVARIKLGLDQHEQASELFRESIKAAPSYAFAHAGLVRARTAAKDFDGALLVGHEALESASAGGWNEVRLALGHVHLARGEYEEALSSFDRAAEDKSRLVADRAQAGLVHSHMAAGRLRRALDLADTFDDNRGAYVEIQSGFLHAEVGEYGVALERFANAQRRLPRSVTAIRGHARTLRLLGCFHAALLFLDEKSETLPHDRQRELDNERGWSELALEHYDAAARHFERAINSSQAESAHRGTIAVAGHRGAETATITRLAQEAFTKLGDRPAAVYAEAGAALLRSRQLTDAHEWFRMAEETSNGEGTRRVLKLYVAHEFIAARALADAELAISEMENESLSHGVDDPRINLARARMFLAAEDPDAALERYQAVLEHWPKNAVALLGAAMAAFRCEDLRRAELNLDRALDACPENVSAAEVKAWTLLRGHDEESTRPGGSEKLVEAAELCARIRALEPHHSGVFECLTEIATLRGSMSVAEIYLSEVQRAGNSADFLRSRAVLYLRTARYEEAVTSLTDAIAQTPDDVTLRLLLGMAHLRRGHREDAIGSLRQAVAMQPSNLLARVPLATALQGEGRSEDALLVLGDGLLLASGRRRLPLLLARSRVASSAAAHTDSRQARRLLDQALGELEQAASIARDLQAADQVRAEVDYHRGVVLEQLGRRNAAQKALKSCESLDSAHEHVKEALSVLGDAEWSDPNERRTLEWARVLGSISMALLVVAVLTAWAQAGWHASRFTWEPLIWIVGALLAVFIIAATLPRLVGLDVGGQLKFSLQPSPPTSEQSSGHLSFAKITALSSVGRVTVGSKLMVGPSAYQPSQMSPNREGDD